MKSIQKWVQFCLKPQKVTKNFLLLNLHTNKQNFTFMRFFSFARTWHHACWLSRAFFLFFRMTWKTLNSEFSQWNLINLKLCRKCWKSRLMDMRNEFKIEISFKKNYCSNNFDGTLTKHLSHFFLSLWNEIVQSLQLLCHLSPCRNFYFAILTWFEYKTEKCWQNCVIENFNCNHWNEKCSHKSIKQ